MRAPSSVCTRPLTFFFFFYREKWEAKRERMQMNVFFLWNFKVDDFCVYS